MVSLQMVLMVAAEWYRSIDSELAQRFLVEIYSSIEKATLTPLHYRVIDVPYRRVLSESFPYRIIFELIEELQAVHVVAISHQKCHPEHWKERL